MNPLISAMREADFIKLGYGKNIHAKLMGKTIKSGLGSISPEAKQLLVRGAVESDSGLRHPWLPWNDVQHAFPSVKKEELRRELRIMHNDALDQLAKGVADPNIGDMKRNVLLTRALLGVGHAQHAQMDVGSHYDKPLELARKSGDESVIRRTKQIRSMVRTLPGYYGGIISSGAEHVQAGLKFQLGGKPKSNIDQLEPSSYKSDSATLRNADAYGKAVRSGLLQRLRKDHGLGSAQAEEAVQKRLGSFRPSALERVAGGVLDTATHAVQQVQRAGRLPEVMSERQKFVFDAASKILRKVV